MGDAGKHTNPLVVWLVDVLVDAGVVLEAVDPVNGNIVKSHVQYR